MSDSPDVLKDAKKRIVLNKVLPGEALHRARVASKPQYALSDLDRLSGHVGKRIQFTFSRQLLIGTLVHVDTKWAKVVIEYDPQGDGKVREFRCPLKNLGKYAFLED